MNCFDSGENSTQMCTAVTIHCRIREHMAWIGWNHREISYGCSTSSDLMDIGQTRIQLTVMTDSCMELERDIAQEGAEGHTCMHKCKDIAQECRWCLGDNPNLVRMYLGISLLTRDTHRLPPKCKA